MIEGRFRVDPYKNSIAVSINSGVLLVGVHKLRAVLLFGSILGNPDFANSQVCPSETDDTPARQEIGAYHVSSQSRCNFSPHFP